MARQAQGPEIWPSSALVQKVKGLFKRLNVDAKVVELDTIVEGEEIQGALRDITGRRTVPQVFVGGDFLGGADGECFDPEKIPLIQVLSSLCNGSSCPCAPWPAARPAAHATRLVSVTGVFPEGGCNGPSHLLALLCIVLGDGRPVTGRIEAPSLVAVR